MGLQQKTIKWLPSQPQPKCILADNITTALKDVPTACIITRKIIKWSVSPRKRQLKKQGLI